MLAALSLLTCQTIRFNYFNLQNRAPGWLQKAAKYPLYFLMLLAFLANIAPAGCVLAACISSQAMVLNLTLLFEEILNSKFEYNLTDPIHDIRDIHDMKKLVSFGVYSELVILLLTMSSGVSYALFIIVLICTYNCYPFRRWIRKIISEPEDDRQNDNKALNPFCIKEKEIGFTKVYLPESLYFVLLFLINISLWLACYIVFSLEVFDKPSHFTNIDIQLEQFVFFLYMYSQLCTIVSCFIFSKIAYSVTHRCLKLYDEFKNHNKLSDVDDGLSLLIEKDDDFTKMGQDTLNLFEIWFTIHWVSYIVTSFFSIVLFLGILENKIEPRFSNIPDKALGFIDSEFAVITLFTVQHCFLFLYPCFKAAAVTVGREKLIKKINAHRLEGHPLTLERKQLYIQYLENKKFGFRISFFCARIPFGFNIAYISIFIGLMSMLIKFSDI